MTYVMSEEKFQWNWHFPLDTKATSITKVISTFYPAVQKDF